MNKIFKAIKDRTFFKKIVFHLKLKRAFHFKGSDKDYLINLGNLFLGYKMDLDNPTTFNEKLNYYKLYYDNSLIYDVVDKIKVKDYVKSKCLNDIIINTITTYDDISMIDLEKLPDSFVIKNTQDSGGVFICRNKRKISKEDIIKKLQNLDKQFINGKHWALERAYNGENKIIVEELIVTEDGHAPWDYKFFCFNGEPKFLFVGSDRDTNVCFDFFDIDFNHLDVIQGHPHSKKEIKKPENYEYMLEICRVLSKDFPHVRVDLYNVDGRIYFGELTFYHFAGLTPFEPVEWDYEFGKYFDVSTIKSTDDK